MKIIRNLKHGSFQWDDETKKFKITKGDSSVELGKVYAFNEIGLENKRSQKWL